MMKHWLLFISVLLCVEMGYAQSPAQDRAVPTRQAPGLERMHRMRFYPPRNTVSTPPSWQQLFFGSELKQEHRQALALYFFNMYVTSRAYNRFGSPSKLTLNELGVLDSFFMCREPFPFEKASSFFKDNREEIQTYLNQYVQGKQELGAFPSYEELISWAKLLETLPRRDQKATYAYAAPYLLKTTFFPPMAHYLKDIASLALSQNRNLAILYNTADVQLEDLDHHIGNSGSHQKSTYRWIKDECFYSSYVIARYLNNLIVHKPTNWQATRIYLITAYPSKDPFLQAAAGKALLASNGKAARYWQYHTAVLILLEQDRRFSPVILDTILNSTQPTPLEQWQANFHPNTLFTVQPFRRQEQVEKALQTPEKVENNFIWVGGKRYSPAPVLQ